ncbi:MAG: 2-hydroxyacyl-CoA dehydratase family protein [Peptococcaceae bacterium]|nr:2-hydroxyacyl-CoA dehydratase family protein [Peptococcaceae bacterium]
MNAEKSPGRRLECARKLKNIGVEYYMECVMAKQQGRPLAWITSGFPVELVYAMDVIPFYPENYGTLCGSRKVSGELCQMAEARGYSQDLCSYARCTLGSMYENAGPLNGLPAPDMILTARNICHTVIKWWEAVARYYNCPLFVLDTPFVQGGLTGHQVRYVREQIMEMIGFLERHTGREFNMDRFMEVIGRSNQGTALWREIQLLRKASPCPVSALDMFTCMFPIVTLRGTAACVDFYREMRDELADRVARGVGVLEEDRYRLMWDNIAIWYNFQFYDYIHSRGGVFVGETYTSAWGVYQFDQSGSGDLFDSLVRSYSMALLNIDLDLRFGQMADMIREYGVEGLILHSNRSCKTYSLGQLGLARRVQNELGVPVLIIEADMTDPRAFAEGPTRTRVDAFLELLSERKAR